MCSPAIGDFLWQNNTKQSLASIPWLTKPLLQRVAYANMQMQAGHQAPPQNYTSNALENGNYCQFDACLFSPTGLVEPNNERNKMNS